MSDFQDIYWRKRKLIEIRPGVWESADGRAYLCRTDRHWRAIWSAESGCQIIANVTALTKEEAIAACDKACLEAAKQALEGLGNFSDE